MLVSVCTSARYVCACARACVRACARACVRVCARACVRACVRVRVRACVRTHEGEVLDQWLTSLD